MCHLGLNMDLSSLQMKNRNLICSGIDQSTSTIDGRNGKKHHKGQLDKSFNLASLTHDDEPKPSDLKKTAAVHDGLIVSYNTAWRANNSVHTTQTIAALKSFELIILYLQWWNEENVRSTVH